MAFSQNEIEAMCKRAARGAGLPWGIAEEAGKAARWLSAHDLPGPEALAEILTRNDGKSYDDLVPISVENTWRARSGRLCPLVSGAALSDRAALLAAGRAINLGPTSQPLMLCPYAAGAAEQTGSQLDLMWNGVVMTISGRCVSIDGDLAAVFVRGTEAVTCSLSARKMEPVLPRTRGRTIDAETWSRLSAFAQRTLAPATEASRLSGAGAGLTDTD